MKKYLLILIGSSVFVLNGYTQLVIASQTFASGFANGWSSVNNESSGGRKWVFKKNPVTTTDYSPFTFSSATSDNGYACIISDGYTSPINTDLISPSFDCSGSSYVALEFQYLLAVKQGGAPVAQVWVSTDNSDWTMVYDMLQNSTASNPTYAAVDISAYAAYSSTVYLKFNYQATNDVFLCLDDINLLDIIQTDAAMSSINLTNYTPITDNFLVTCSFANVGESTLNSITLNYSIDGGPAVSETTNGYLLQLFDTQNYIFNHTAQITTAGLHTITVWTSSPNGQKSAGNSYDTLAASAWFIDHKPHKNVFVEEFATAPCGYCPGGAIFVNQLIAAEGSYAIAVTHHAGYLTDEMTLLGDDSMVSAFISAAPEASIDRLVYPDDAPYQGGEGIVGISTDGLGAYNDLSAFPSGQSAWEHYTQIRSSAPTPVSVSATNTFDDATRQLNVTVSATFYASVSGNLSMNAYVIEDSIVGHGIGWDQVSYYHDSPTDTSINPYYLQGFLSNEGYGGEEWFLNGFVFNHVVRDYLGNTWGSFGVIPSTTSADSTYTVQYNIVAPDNWRASHLSIVAFVNYYNDDYGSTYGNQVLNAIKIPLNGIGQTDAPVVTLSGISELPVNRNEFSLYPNPVDKYTYVRYTALQDTRIGFEVYNSVGQMVTSIPATNISKGSNSTYLNTEKYENGLYLVVARDQDNVVQTLKFVVNR